MSCFRAESTGFLQKCFLLDVQLLSPAPKSRSGTLISGRLLLLCFCFRHKNPKIPQKMLTNYHPGGNIYRQSMDCKTEYGRVPEWPMGTDCKSAAFSFGGSNPPAPTKRTSVEITLVFCFARHPKSHSRGWIRTAAATSLKMAQKQPGGLFLAARLATSTRAHQKNQRRNYAGFLFCPAS